MPSESSLVNRSSERQVLHLQHLIGPRPNRTIRASSQSRPARPP